jgi:hypothetical protein
MSLHDLKNKNSDTGGTIASAVRQVMEQVEYHCFEDPVSSLTDPLYRELCLVMAEVSLLDPDAYIKINADNIRVHLVQEVYRNLQHDHVYLVFSNLNNVASRIYNKKAYVRTALYNSFFELESHYTNVFRLNN